MRWSPGLLFLMMLVACSSPGGGDSSSTAPAAAPESAATEDDWTVLFDGSSLDGWRGYNAETMPPGWKIEGDVLTFDDGAKTSDAEYEGGKDIIYGAREFDNFELVLDWKIPAGGNSGIFYHVKEGYGGPPEVAPEYQLIDDENYTKIHDISAYNAGLGYGPELQDWQSTGADYAMYPAPMEGRNLKPAGEWNTSRILFTPERAEYWLNGKLVVNFVPWSDDWQKRRDSGKWSHAPDYGKFKSGYIGLQDHDSALWFRNIKIREL
ncbi:DUF1080 domain-containing protein [Lewinella sp. 4G2]|uniref:3-keto-disaccharide hydrolase n=1 Tax=Lewinella sp. 4G2 TaxID=1803372 RepID=UPI0007B480E3|nr:DUF1080 domain-containing protein [Lewinella sp. 4G2]OAV42823.1 glycosyl hydrolase [Lewinella sp. 4G2]